MDLETAVSAITTIAGAAGHVISGASDYIPEEISRGIRHAYSYFPTDINLEDAAQFMLYFAAASLILGIIGRVVLGKRSSLNHASSSAMGIAAVYAMTVIIYTFRPWELNALLSPLPFVSFTGEYLILLPISDAMFPVLCRELLSLVILSFLVNLIDTVLPKGESPISWLALRLLGIIGSMLLHLMSTWAVHTYVPEILVEYAPGVLLAILLAMLLSGFVSLIIGLIIAVNSPFLGAMYSFFFSNVIGKQLSKAVFSSAILCGVFFLLDHFGYTVICISAAALITYIPLLLVLVLLWYLLGSVL